jgi:hypothetical protein
VHLDVDSWRLTNRQICREQSFQRRPLRSLAWLTSHNCFSPAASASATPVAAVMAHMSAARQKSAAAGARAAERHAAHAQAAEAVKVRRGSLNRLNSPEELQQSASGSNFALLVLRPVLLTTVPQLSQCAEVCSRG